MASFSVSRGRAPRSTIGMYGENARCPCTPPSTVETFGEEISAEACSGKEIAGLLRKMMMMMRMMMMMTMMMMTTTTTTTTTTTMKMMMMMMMMNMMTRKL